MPGPTRVKELYLAENLEKLNELVKEAEDKLKSSRGIEGKNILDKIYKNADDKERAEKDEEVAYVLYMRFLAIIKHIQKAEPGIMKEYGTRIALALERCSALSESLSKRYKTSKDCKQAEAEYMKLELKDAEENLSRSVTAKAMKISGLNGVVSPITSNPYGITTGELKSLMDQRSTRFLLIDCRSSSDYDSSHPNHPHCISISNVILEKGLSANSLGPKIKATNPDSHDIWMKRASFDLIILYDWNSSFEQRDPGVPISVLYDAMTKWDPNTKYEGKIKVLQGGIRRFYREYPTYLTNPPSKEERSDSVSSITLSLSNIAYPSIEDEKPPPLDAEENNNPKIAKAQKGLPNSLPKPTSVTVDRSNKPTQPKTKEVKVEPHLNGEHKSSVSSESLPKDVQSKSKTVVKPLEDGRSLPVQKFEDFAKPDTAEPRAPPIPSSAKPSQAALKRSRSNPNLANACFAEERPPSFSRNLKPHTRREFSPVSSTERSHRTGLKNLGNTCYMSSIVQCLSHTRRLADFLMSDAFRLEAIGPTRGEVTKEVAMTIQQLHMGHRSIAPEELKRVIGKHFPAFQGYTQQDAHELLTLLLDSMQEELNRVKVKVPLPEQENDGLPLHVAGQKFWKNYLNLNQSIISELFCGEIKSFLRCGGCQKESVKFEAFYFLQLQIPGSSKCSLQGCFDLYTSTELLQDTECAHCRKTGKVQKKIDFWRLPQYLIVQIKRFHNTAEGNWRKRINEVDCPIDNLDMSPRVVGETDRDYKYQLYAVSNHYGSMEGGHYTAFCRNPDSWIKFDDSDVSTISPREVCTTAAYILFYQLYN